MFRHSAGDDPIDQLEFADAERLGNTLRSNDVRAEMNSLVGQKANVLQETHVLQETESLREKLLLVRGLFGLKQD